MKLSSVDYFKLFFAVCIVALHTRLLHMLPEQQSWYCIHMVLRLGVPYFFVASGYFWGLKVHKKNNDTTYVQSCRNNYIKRNLPPLLFWSFWGLLFFSIAKIYKSGLVAIPLIIKTGLFYPLGAMWFVSSCIVAVIIIAALHNKSKLLLILGGGGYFFALICNTYYFLICDNPTIKTVVDSYMDIFISARNGIFVGLLFVGLGFSLSKEGNFLKRMKTRTVFLLFAITYIFLFLETRYTFQKETLDDNSLLLSLPLVSIFLFELTLRVKIKEEKTGTALEARRMSVNIYFMHRFFYNTVVIYIMRELSLNSLVQFSIILVVCLIAYFLTRNSRNRFIRMILP